MKLPGGVDVSESDVSEADLSEAVRRIAQVAIPELSKVDPKDTLDEDDVASVHLHRRENVCREIR